MQQHAYFMFPYIFHYFTYAVTNRIDVFHSFFQFFLHNIIIIIDRKVIWLWKDKEY